MSRFEISARIRPDSALIVHSFFYKNIFDKNIEAEICEILEYFKNKAKAEILKRIDIILCVETSVNTIQF